MLCFIQRSKNIVRINNQLFFYFLIINEIMVIIFNFTPISSLLYLYNLANIHIKEHLYSDTLY